LKTSKRTEDKVEISLKKFSTLKHDLQKFGILFNKHLAKLPESSDKKALQKGFVKVIKCLIDEIYGLIDES